MGLIQPVTVPEGQKGAWSVERFEITSIYQDFRALSIGRGIPRGTYTRLRRNGKVIMSDTPSERRDHVGFVFKARDHCLINGLGLGMCLAAILKKPEVSAVTVVEIDKDVIDLVGPHYDEPRVEIVHAIAKVKRMRGETGQGKPKRKIQSRGFDKTKTRTFSGEVRPRT